MIGSNGTLACIHLNGIFFMRINLMPASDNIVTWSEFIRINDSYYYKTDSIIDTLYQIIETYDSNMYPISYVIRISNNVIANFNMTMSWYELWLNYGNELIAINVSLNIKRVQFHNSNIRNQIEYLYHLDNVDAEIDDFIGSDTTSDDDDDDANVKVINFAKKSADDSDYESN